MSAESDTDDSVKLSDEIYSIFAANFVPENLDIVMEWLKPLMRLTLTLFPRVGILPPANVDLRAIIGDMALSFLG